jgi:hypothetical protein
MFRRYFFSKNTADQNEELQEMKRKKVEVLEGIFNGDAEKAEKFYFIIVTCLNRQSAAVFRVYGTDILDENGKVAMYCTGSPGIP